MRSESPVTAPMRPVRKPGVVARDIGDELFLYEVGGREIHILNPTARLVWELCDGEHAVVDMEQAIKARYSVPQGHDLTADIRPTLELLARKGLFRGPAS